MSSRKHNSVRMYLMVASTIAFSIILHGVNLCYARLSQLMEVVVGDGYAQNLSNYYDPFLAVISVLSLLAGIVLMAYAVVQRKESSKTDT